MTLEIKEKSFCVSIETPALYPFPCYKRNKKSALITLLLSSTSYCTLYPIVLPLVKFSLVEIWEATQKKKGNVMSYWSRISFFSVKPAVTLLTICILATISLQEKHARTILRCQRFGMGGQTDISAGDFDACHSGGGELLVGQSGDCVFGGRLVKKFRDYKPEALKQALKDYKPETLDFLSRCPQASK